MLGPTHKAIALERHEDTAASPDHQGLESNEDTQESVSIVLQRAREEYGQDLRSVSDSLRIRYVYLQAIEEGRFDELPGATYAVGFVRTYADYLGLDATEIVRRFKIEVEGLERRTQLVFPVPKPEGKIPGGAIILISLLLVGVAYGGWYFLSQSDQSFVELFSGEEATSDLPLAGTGESATAEATQAPAAPQPAQEPTQDPAPAETSAPAPAAAPATGVETLPPDSPVVAEVLPPPAPTSDAPQAAAAEPEAAEPEASAPEASAPESAASEAAENSAAGIPAAPRSDQLASAETGRVFGEAEAAVRIVVRARQDAWVQVRDAQNQLVLTEVLRSGDVYRVPDESGLSMLTGNAGGLEILVDGQVAPSLGPIGVVRRNVVLDPQRLSQGTAVGAQDQE